MNNIKTFILKQSSILLDVSLLFLLTLAYFWRPIFENKYLFFGGEIANEFFPTLLYNLNGAFAADSPQSLLETNSCLLYPLNFILIFFPSSGSGIDLTFRALQCLFMMHFFLASVFTYALARFGLNLNRYGSLLAAIVYGFAGLRVGHILDFKIAYSATWLPLVFCFICIGFKRGKITYFPLALFFMTFILLGGHAGIFIISFLTVLIFFIYEFCVPAGTFPRSLVFPIGVTFLSMLLFLMLLLFLGWETEIHPSLIERIYQLQWKQLSTLFLPFINRSNFNWWDYLCYGSIGTLFMLPIAYFRLRRDWGFFIILLPVALIFSLANSVPILYFAKFLPLSSRTDEAMDLRVLIYFTMAITAGVGLDFFSSPMTKCSKLLFLRYSRILAGCLVLIAGLISFSLLRLIIEYDTESKCSSVDLANSVVWLAIFSFLFVIIFYMRAWRNGRLLSKIFLLLVIIDLFSFWSFFHPANFGWSSTYQIAPPSERPNTKIEATYGVHDLRRFTNATVLENSLWAKKGEDVNVCGPYEKFPPGKYRVDFHIKTHDNTLNDAIASIRVQKGGGGKIFNIKKIKGTDFPEQDHFETFSLFFEIKKPTQLEFTLHFYGLCGMWLETITIYEL